VFAGSKLSAVKVQHDLELCINRLDPIVSLAALLPDFRMRVCRATSFG
jgi:hypothetical protein